MQTETQAPAKVVFKKIRDVTLPVLVLRENKPRYIRILEPYHAGKILDDKKQAAMIAKSVDLETEEVGLTIAGAVMLKELNETYQGASYVGKCFEIVPQMMRGGEGSKNKYRTYRIAEVADPSEFPVNTAPSSSDLAVHNGKGKK